MATSRFTTTTTAPYTVRDNKTGKTIAVYKTYGPALRKAYDLNECLAPEVEENRCA